MPIDVKKREEHHLGVAKKEMTEAELACKPVTSTEYYCRTSFNFLAARDYPASRIKQGLDKEEFNRQELMAICSTRGLKYQRDDAETLTTRLCEYADENLQKGKFYSYISHIIYFFLY